MNSPATSMWKAWVMLSPVFAEVSANIIEYLSEIKMRENQVPSMTEPPQYLFHAALYGCYPCRGRRKSCLLGFLVGGGAGPPGRAPTYNFANFPKPCMKLTIFWTVGGRLGCPLDLPVHGFWKVGNSYQETQIVPNDPWPTVIVM